MGATTYTVTIAADKAGNRLDRALADALPELSRTRVRALIEQGGVRAAGGGAARDPALRVRSGEVYRVEVPEAPPISPRPEPIPLTVVYEDDHLIVVDKPAGLVVHPGAGHAEGTLVNALLAHCPDGLSSIGAPLRPGIVHRLDKDTSGLLVAAKTDAAHHCLARQFAEHRVRRAYEAVVWGNPTPSLGRISLAIGRSTGDRTKMATQVRGGRPAVTEYRTIERVGTLASRLECRLRTGRTHQIRVHLAARGHPVVGDAAYGGRRGAGWSALSEGPASRRFSRHALHAFLIGFHHPEGRSELVFRAPLCSDIRELMDSLEAI